MSSERRFTIDISTTTSVQLSVPSGMKAHLETLLNLVMLAVGQFVFSVASNAKGNSDRNQKGYGVKMVRRELWQFVMWVQPGANDTCREGILTLPASLHNERDFHDFHIQLSAAIETGEVQFTEAQLRERLGELKQTWDAACKKSATLSDQLSTLQARANEAQVKLVHAQRELNDVEALLLSAKNERDAVKNLVAGFEKESLPAAQRIADEAEAEAATARAEHDKLAGQLAAVSHRRVESMKKDAKERLTSREERIALARQILAEES